MISGPAWAGWRATRALVARQFGLVPVPNTGGGSCFFKCVSQAIAPRVGDEAGWRGVRDAALDALIAVAWGPRYSTSRLPAPGAPFAPSWAGSPAGKEWALLHSEAEAADPAKLWHYAAVVADGEAEHALAAQLCSQVRGVAITIYYSLDDGSRVDPIGSWAPPHAADAPPSVTRPGGARVASAPARAAPVAAPILYHCGHYELLVPIASAAAALAVAARCFVSAMCPRPVPRAAPSTLAVVVAPSGGEHSAVLCVPSVVAGHPATTLCYAYAGRSTEGRGEGQAAPPQWYIAVQDPATGASAVVAALCVDSPASVCLRARVRSVPDGAVMMELLWLRVQPCLKVHAVIATPTPLQLRSADADVVPAACGFAMDINHPHIPSHVSTLQLVNVSDNRAVLTMGMSAVGHLLVDFAAPIQPILALGVALVYLDLRVPTVCRGVLAQCGSGSG